MDEMRMYTIKPLCELLSVISILVKNKVLILVHDIFIIRGKTNPIFKVPFFTIQFLLY